MSKRSKSPKGRAREILDELARRGHVDVLHESPSVLAEVNRLLEEEATRDLARLQAAAC